jgi:OOP family OmpA-OmpF porin
MKKTLMVAAMLVGLPVASQAQTLQYPGLYFGGEGGVNWLWNTTVNGSIAGGVANVSPNLGWAAGGMIGYDFVGPRVEAEVLYRNNTASANFAPLGAPNLTTAAEVNQTAIMGNIFYDFLAGQTFVPFVGVGAGIDFVNATALGLNSTSSVFAYQGIVGVGYNVSDVVRLNLSGRYFGTSNPNFGNTPAAGNLSAANNNITVLASFHIKLGAPAAAAAPPAPEAPQAPSFIVFFDWDRSNLSAQALNTIKQAAAAYKTKGSARLTATGHTDKSGPDGYNVALSLRRANAVKDALVREGVPATAISVVGRGKSQPLVQTADGVREPQNRRVEIVIQ